MEQRNHMELSLYNKVQVAHVIISFFLGLLTMLIAIELWVWLKDGLGVSIATIPFLIFASFPLFRLFLGPLLHQSR